MDLVGNAVDFLSGLVSGFTDVLLQTFWSLVKGIVDGLAVLADQAVQLLPPATPLDLPDMTGWIKGYTVMNTFLPLSEALTMTGVLVSIYTALLLWRIGVKVYHLIPKPFVGT